MNNNYIGVDLDLFRQPKIQRLEVAHGKGAVALYIQLYLKLAENNNIILETDIPLLVREFFIAEELLKTVIYDMDLFEIKNGIIYSTIIAEKLSAIKKLQKAKSEAGKLGAAKRWSNKDKDNKTNGSANGSAITDPIAKNSNKTKIKQNKTKQILDHFNQTHNRKLKSTHAWEDNFNFWLQTYTIDEIKTAISRLNHPDWWAKEKPDLELLFRKSNKAGKCDYISQLLELEETVEEDDGLFVVDRSKYETEEDFERYMHWVKTRFQNRFKIINKNND